ncbi:MAG: hypothetical protein KDA85_21245, partial [Planctomycetaceae bacterium]|nr:hypothetical protein [Planctomycetaceae bacterium]
IRMLLVADHSDALRSLTCAYCHVAEESASEGGRNLKLTCWRYLPSGSKRENIADEDWNLEKLQWIAADPDKHADHLRKLKRLNSEAGNIDAAARNISFLFPGQQASDTPAGARFAGDPTVPLLVRELVEEAAITRMETFDGALGIWLQIEAPRAWNRFCGEDGLHRLTSPDRSTVCSVFCGVGSVEDYLPPNGIIRAGAVKAMERCREYDAGKMRIVDRAEGESQQFVTLSNLKGLISQLLHRRLRRMAESLLDE